MSSGDSHELETLKQQVLALRERVARIEQALAAPAGAGHGQSPHRPSARHQTADADARMAAALDEYRDREALEHLRRNPSVARNYLENAQKQAAFLRERGLEPQKTRMEDLARQVVDELSEKEKEAEEERT